MSDAADLSKITTLEARLAAAMERITKGVEGHRDALATDTTLADALREAEVATAAKAEAEARVTTLTERVRALEEARKADQDEAARRNEAATGGSDETEKLTAQIATLTKERDTARAERDALAAARKAEAEEIEAILGDLRQAVERDEA